jgi:hypothetical protein
VHEHFNVDMSKVREIFIDATYNTSKIPVLLYALVAEELGYGVLLGFMLVKIGGRENTRGEISQNQALKCNRNFYLKGKELGLDPQFIHTDRDWSEISAHQVSIYLICANSSRV